MKSNYSAKSSVSSAATSNRSVVPKFSHRLARPSLNSTFTALSNSRLDDLWDSSLLDRLHTPLTRHPY